MQTYVTQNYIFLHDIVESFSSMINVAFVIFLNSPTASSIVPWQIFKLRFIGEDAKSTPSQIVERICEFGVHFRKEA